MIPKVIHYCWFGGKELPQSARKYIESWETFLPEYEIKRWDESNFNVNIIPYTEEAYARKKYAFVSDYARFWIIYTYGGIYFDTDVEVVSKLDDIVCQGDFFGVESQDDHKISVAPGLGFGAEAGNAMIKDLLELYKTFHFISKDGNLCMKNVVETTTEYLILRGLRNTDEIQECCGFRIYPKDFFCPIDYDTRNLSMTANTRTIHHYAESWVPRSARLKNWLSRVFGRRFIAFLVKTKNIILN